MDTLFKQPSTDSDLRFVMRCLWSLDPDYHLFEGDFRDFARERISRMLAPLWASRDIPELVLDEIEHLLKSHPCSTATRQCWEGIERGMRRNLDSVHVMSFGSREYELWQFIRQSFGYGSGSYWSARDLTKELEETRRLAYNEILESVASTFRHHLDPGSVEGALILWALWCLEILLAGAGRQA